MDLGVIVPAWPHRAGPLEPESSVRSNAISGSIAAGNPSWEGNQVNTKGNPLDRGRDKVGNGRHILSVNLHRCAEAERIGPAIATRAWSTRRTHGTMFP